MPKVNRNTSSKHLLLFKDTLSPHDSQLSEYGYQTFVFPQKLLLGTGPTTDSISVVLGPLLGNSFRARKIALENLNEENDFASDFFIDLDDKQIKNAKVLVISALQSKADKIKCEAFLNESKAKMCSLATYVGNRDAKIDLQQMLDAKNVEDLESSVKHGDYVLKGNGSCCVVM
mmetsp:Transcript_12320/g.14274  ORF Transcript_12320/g.14274 Transcript_12320/m.14274 type:complete len:174 (+) Transcript_12320:186-707(+)